MQIELTQHVAAAPEKVFAFYTDHVGWERWAGVKEVVLRQTGDPPPNGLGAIRVIRARGMAFEEEITAFEPPRRMGYRLEAGPPLRDQPGAERVGPPAAAKTITWGIPVPPPV